MLKELISSLYKLSRKAGKTASTLNDISTLATLDPDKIARRAVRKTVNKKGNNILRNINKKI